MRKRINKMQSPNGLGWGQEALFDLPSGVSMSEIVLKLGADVRHSNLHYQVVVNAETIYDISGDDVSLLHAVSGRTQNAHYVVLPFSDITAQTDAGRMMNDLVVNQGEIATLKVKIGAKPGDSNVMVPEISGDIVYALTASQRTTVSRLASLNTPSGAVGERQINWGFPKRSIKSIDLIGGVDKLTIEKDGLKLFEQSIEDNNFRLRRNGWTPQADIYHFRPSIEKYHLSDLFVAGANTKFIINATTGDSIKVLMNTVESVAVVKAGG